MKYYVYILTNHNNKLLYIGMTNNLIRRVWEHKNELVDGYTKRYHIHKLVYFEEAIDVNVVIQREKQLKSWSRKRKNDLIEEVNPNWEEVMI